jgi:iron complex outermembrane receptor protein
MSKRILSALLGASALTSAIVCAAPAFAQDDSGMLEEVVVTARRRAENVQDIPVTVQAISGEKLQQQAVTQFTDISKLAPGLNISFASGSKGTNAEVILRGVKWSAAAGTPAIPMYLNEMDVNPNYMVLSLFDIQQLEVLRGPQGTTRGAPSISGAITLTSKQPNLDDLGGYIQGLLGNHDHRNIQGGVSVPIIKEKLGIRLAGMIDDNQGNRVRSLNNSKDPHLGTDAARVTVLWEPIDSVSANLTYQYVDYATDIYDQIAGPGSAGFTVPAGTLPGQTPRVLPPNFNGPAIATDDYLAVNGVRSSMQNRADIWGLNLKWDVAGHTLSYIGGYQASKSAGLNSQDPGNQLGGYDPVQDLISETDLVIHELRFASNPDPDRMIDYVAGAYFYSSKGSTYLYNTAAYLPGAFGPFGVTPDRTAVNPLAAERYRLPQFGNIIISSENYSFYGSATLHLGQNTELTGGVRRIHDHRQSFARIYVQNGVLVTPASPTTGCAGAIGFSGIYAGHCERVQAGPGIVVNANYDKTFTPTIWNTSLSHKFTPDILGYVTVGTSWRGGQNNVGVFTTDENVAFSDPEKATSYEAGLKTSWMDNRLRLNASVFQIDYKGQITQFPSIQYWANNINGVSRVSSAFYQNVDSKVKGVEAEFAFEPVRNLTLGATAAYAKITSEGSLAPCDNPAIPLSPTNVMNFCPLAKGRVLNTIPKFTASVNGQYVLPMDKFDGFVRFNLAHRGANPNFGYVTSAKAYDLFDLFAGLRAQDGAWEVLAYAKNLFNEKSELTRTQLTNNLLPAGGSVSNTFGAPGYFLVSSTVPREIGVQLRYAFGSR